MTKSEWVSVKERLPKNWGMYLLAYYRYRHENKYIDHQVIHFNNETNRFNIEYTDDEPLYWMELPELPNEINSDEDGNYRGNYL